MANIKKTKKVKAPKCTSTEKSDKSKKSSTGIRSGRVDKKIADKIILTRSGRIRKKTDSRLKVVDSILKTELQINNKNMKKKKGQNSVQNTKQNNNNDFAVSDQNKDKDTIYEIEIDIGSKVSQKRLNGITKSKTVKEKTDLIRRNNKSTQIKQLKNLTEDMGLIEHEFKVAIEPEPENGIQIAKCKEPNVDEKGPRQTNTSLQTKQVTLSNGLVLTLTVFTCDHCNKQFNDKYGLTRHMIIHDENRPACPHCKSKFSHKATLKKHLAKYHSNKEKVEPELHICHICDKPFLMKENLELHLDTHVKPENNFKCIFCGKTFTYKLLLTQHERTQHSINGLGAEYKCFLCDFIFETRQRLAIHMKSHTKVREYICQYCAKGFIRLSSIKRHVRVCHVGHTIQCPICLKNLKGHLNDHMKLHEDNRPHKCPECGQSFRQATQLTVHRRSHSGVRPYVCKICDRPFAHSNALILHIRRHTGEKPFKCPMCPLAFSQLPHMKGHMKKIHGKESTYKCLKCNQFFKLKVELEEHSKTCIVGDRELSLEEQIEASVQQEEEEVESVLGLSKLRYLVARLLTIIASKKELRMLGFNKRLIDELLEESLEAMGRKPCMDKSISTIKRIKTNIDMFLERTIPKYQMEKFRSENKTTEELLLVLTGEKKE